ncbi:hypothetical protein Fot_30498 [Forsythia ovata]|uniref:PB1-like domain-containing protein n=1 Tax=Forsythia ovata TaxID=205694 RepID=A0ABD1TUY7_9LAMI
MLIIDCMSSLPNTEAIETPRTRFRLYHEEAPIYSKESTYFTVKIHHGGIMFTKPNNLVYEHGDVDYMDYVQSSNLNRELLDKLVEGVGLDLPMGFLYKKQKFSLLEGLVRICSNVDIDMLLKDRNGANELRFTSCLLHELMNWNGTRQFQYQIDHHHQK